MNKIYPEYATTDITLAAVLKENGNVLDRILTQKKMGIFYFLDVEEVTLQNYETGKLLVEPSNFHVTVRNLTAAVRRISQE